MAEDLLIPELVAPPTKKRRAKLPTAMGNQVKSKMRTRSLLPSPVSTATLTIVVSSRRDRLPTLHQYNPSIAQSASFIRPAAHIEYASFARKLL